MSWKRMPSFYPIHRNQFIAINPVHVLRMNVEADLVGGRGSVGIVDTDVVGKMRRKR